MRDVGPAFHQVEEPRAIRRLAVEYRADDAIVLQDQPLVDAGGRIAQHDFLAVRRFGKIACRKQVDAGDLELRVDDGAMIFAGPADEAISENPCGLIKGRNEPIADAAMFGAFAERKDVRVRGHHPVVDDDAAVDGDAGILGKARGRADADGHDHHIAGDDAAVIQLDTLDLVGAKDPLGIGLGDDVDAAFGERLFEQIGGRRIELTVHDGRVEVNDGHLHALPLQPVSSLQAQQPGADDDGAALGARNLDHLLDIGEIAVGENAGQLVTRNRDDERERTGGDDKLVIGCGDAVGRGDRLRLAVDLSDPCTLVQCHAMGGVPMVIVDDDVVVALFAGQNRREHDAVIVDARFGVEDGHVETTGGLFEQLFQHATGRHAVADDNDLFRHVGYSAASTKR